MDLAFTKMQGCANDYIYLDCRAAGLPQQIEALARKWSARHFSIGADGIVCICAPQTPGAAAFMRIYNADGSEGKMCGNGIRCVAEWLRTHDAACAARDELLIDTLSGPKTLRWQGEGQWQVEMGCYSAMAADLPAVHMGPGPLVGCTLSAAGRDWNVTCISVGNPHCVTVVEDVDGMDLAAVGPAFERHENFPERINTEFVQKLDEARIRMRVWERGSGETWACGTGATASVYACILTGRTEDKVKVSLVGGDLEIRLERESGHLFMTGPAVEVFTGNIDIPKNLYYDGE